MMMDIDDGPGAEVVSDFEELDSDEAPKAKSKATSKAAPKTKKAAPAKKAPAKGKGKKAVVVSQ
jgi:double-strand break repair protein MRE11